MSSMLTNMDDVAIERLGGRGRTAAVVFRGPKRDVSGTAIGLPIRPGPCQGGSVGIYSRHGVFGGEGWFKHLPPKMSYNVWSFTKWGS